MTDEDERDEFDRSESAGWVYECGIYASAVAVAWLLVKMIVGALSPG